MRGIPLRAQTSLSANCARRGIPLILDWQLKVLTGGWGKLGSPCPKLPALVSPLATVGLVLLETGGFWLLCFGISSSISLNDEFCYESENIA